MDARRYDRNADQLSQIFWHTNRLPKQINGWTNENRARLLELLEEALKINDKLGQMAEKGLI